MKPEKERGRITLQSVTGQALALVPLFVGVVFGALALPRAVPPTEIPLPRVDGRALSSVEAEDAARASRVEAAALGSRLRGVGSALRAFNRAEAKHEDADTLARAHIAMVDIVRTLGEGDYEALKDLRAFQMLAFLTEVHRYDRTGTVSDDLVELGGTFVDRMIAVGWCSQPDHHVRMPDAALRTAFKLTWNHTVGLDGIPAFTPALDENRALYAFYLAHPHAGQVERQRLAAAAASPDTIARDRAEDAARRASVNWSLVKVRELSQIDPSYPAPLAHAAGLYMNRDFRGAAVEYQGWLDAHPDGPWTLRTQNHLRAALLAGSEAQ